MAPAVCVLLDAPSASTTVDRLTGDIGVPHAQRLYRLLARRTLDAAREARFGTVVWYRPMAAHAEMRAWLGDAVELRPQASGPLGARLGAAVASVNVPAGWLAIVRDVAGIDAALLAAAARALDDSSFVVGPTADGGCYLLGGREHLPEAMRRLAHARAGALADVRDGLGASGSAWHELAVLPAIETATDARAARLLT